MRSEGLERRLWNLLPQRLRSGPTMQAVRAARLRAGGVPAVSTLDDGVFDRFDPYTGPGEPGFLIDFLGGRTRLEYLAGHEQFDGVVVGVPKRESPVLHEHDEWLGALMSVVAARDRDELVAIELGAGWGPWLVSSALAARQLGEVETVRLVGVEAVASHHAMMLTHFRDNGLDPDAHTLLVGAVGDTRGIARFPRLPDPAADWGPTELHLENGSFVDELGRRFGAFEEITRYPIVDLVSGFGLVDLLHIDIQGAEETAIPAGMDALSAHVRRVVVGTHGFRFDRHISDVFDAAGWAIEARQPSILSSTGDLARDGVQVWRNQRFD